MCCILAGEDLSLSNMHNFTGHLCASFPKIQHAGCSSVLLLVLSLLSSYSHAYLNENIAKFLKKAAKIWDLKKINPAVPGSKEHGESFHCANTSTDTYTVSI